MKPFNLDAALRGEPVCTVSGDPVYELHKFERVPKLAGVMRDSASMWGLDGRLVGGRVGSLDLRMAPKKRQMWVRPRRSRFGFGIHVCRTDKGLDPIWRDDEGEYVADPVLVYEWEE